MNFNDLMKELGQEYIANLPEKISEIELNCKTGDVSHLREDFHKLKGTGKTYGFPEISQLAETVERICLQQPEHAVEAAAEAVKILKSIHHSRLQERALDLLTIQDYLKIQRLAS